MGPEDIIQDDSLPHSDELHEDRAAQIEASVRGLGFRVAESLLAADAVSLDALLATGFVLRMSGGERIPKEDLLRRLADRQIRYESLVLEIAGVHLYEGEIAFFFGHCNTDKHFHGQRTATRLPYAALSVYRGGAWKVVSIYQMESDAPVPVP